MKILIIVCAIILCFLVYHLAKDNPEWILEQALKFAKKHGDVAEGQFYVIDDPEHEVRYIKDSKWATKVAKNISRKVQKPVKASISEVSIFDLCEGKEFRIEEEKKTTHILSGGDMGD